MPATSSPLRRDGHGTHWVEVALLAPAIGLLLLGVLEVRHGLNVEARLAAAANRVAMAGGDAIPSERTAVSAALHVTEAEVQIVAGQQTATGRVMVTVPYSQTGSALAFLWPDAIVSGESRVLR